MIARVADAHCHLADLPDPEAAVREAETAGVGPILAVSMGPADGARVLQLKQRHPGQVLAGVGLHPSRVPEITDEQAAEELRLLTERLPEADFIGEIGLDYRDAVGEPDRRRQREILGHLLDLAERSRRPVNLHTCRADRELVMAARTFTRRTGLGAVLHWFTHSEKLARVCGGEGIYISVGPSIESDPRQMAVARVIARDFLLVETDSPVAYAGREARPAWAAGLIGLLARERAEEREALAGVLARNLERFLGQAP